MGSHFSNVSSARIFSSYFVGQGDQSNSFWPEDLSKLSTFLCWQCLQGRCVDEFATWKIRVGLGKGIGRWERWINEKTAIRNHRTSLGRQENAVSMVKVEVHMDRTSRTLFAVGLKFIEIQLAIVWLQEERLYGKYTSTRIILSPELLTIWIPTSILLFKISCHYPTSHQHLPRRKHSDGRFARSSGQTTHDILRAAKVTWKHLNLLMAFRPFDNWKRTWLKKKTACHSDHFQHLLSFLLGVAEISTLIASISERSTLIAWIFQMFCRHWGVKVIVQSNMVQVG